MGAGRNAVIAMLLVGLLATGFAWWWNFNRGRDSLTFFGAEGARIIRMAPKVEILVPVTDEAAGEPTGNVMRRYGAHAVRRVDVSQARGLIHARTSLLSDSSYAPKTAGLLHTTAYFIRFSDSANQILLGFTEPDGAIQIAESGEYRPLIQKTADGWRQFIERNVKQTKTEPNDGDPNAGSPMLPAPTHKGPSE